jgi:TrmH family RNA methyltransferase
MYQKISSNKNPKIKHLLELQAKSKIRTKEKLFVIEGYKEVSMALEEGFSLHSLFFNPGICTYEELSKLNFNLPDHMVFELDSNAFSKIAYRESTGGVVAIAHQKSNKLEDLKISDNTLLLCTEGIEKPGNVGAILRTADAANLEAVIICDGKTDLYNPNVIRSSVGCIFSRQIACCTSEEAIAWLKRNNIKIYPTALTASKPYDEIDYSESSAFVMGTEATGLTNLWLQNSTQNIIIPMEGINDSLNVSVSAAIVTFEAKRQRK